MHFVLSENNKESNAAKRVNIAIILMNLKTFCLKRK